MNRNPISVLAAFALAMLLFTACQTNDKAVNISNFDVHEVLKSASRSYEVVLDGSDTVYLNVYTSIHWPVKFGNSDLGPLRDTLLSRMYRVEPQTNVDNAIAGFIDTDSIFGSEAKMHAIDSIPLGSRDGIYEIDYSAKLLELTERTVTYMISNSSFLGGAHPNYATYPFSYDLENAEVLNTANMFKPGSEEALLPLIKEALAAQEGVAVSRLDTADIFVDQMFVSPIIYVTNGGIVFHYNPYEIAPYYKGTIDVEVPAFVLAPYLTPLANNLING